MNRFATAVAVVSFALASGFATAQVTAPGGPDRAKIREGMKAAHEACKDKPDHRACMMETMCAKSPDMAKCMAGAKERHARMSKRMDERQQMHEACNGKRGEELGKCLRAQREKLGIGHGRRG